MLTFHCPCRVIFIEYMRVFNITIAISIYISLGRCNIIVLWWYNVDRQSTWIKHMDAVFGHDDAYCSYQVECMYIHYELCILRFYEACLGLVGFSMLGLSASHGQRIWVVTHFNFISSYFCIVFNQSEWLKFIWVNLLKTRIKKTRNCS